MFIQFVSLISILILSLILAEEIPPPDYCDPKWCPHQGSHIACNNTGDFSPDCEGEFWIVDLTDYKELILDLHNEKRNEFALGEVPGFEAAIRMPSLTWDNKLTKMAELNVKTCHFEHDECRSTSEFPYCGQNIYFAQTTFTNYTTEDFITEAVEMWFEEHKDADMDLMKEFRVTDPQTGHFTALMLDRNNRVGCAYLEALIEREMQKPLTKIIFTCNYPSTNILDIPTYKPGPTASLCNKTHVVFKGLCDETEVVDTNDFTWYLDEEVDEVTPTPKCENHETEICDPDPAKKDEELVETTPTAEVIEPPPYDEKEGIECNDVTPNPGENLSVTPNPMKKDEELIEPTVTAKVIEAPSDDGKKLIESNDVTSSPEKNLAVTENLVPDPNGILDDVITDDFADSEEYENQIESPKVSPIKSFLGSLFG